MIARVLLPPLENKKIPPTANGGIFLAVHPLSSLARSFVMRGSLQPLNR